MFDWFIKNLAKDNRGFTLIELVVVIAILAILALIAVPRLAGTTKKADISAHNANVRSLESAATMCVADNPGIQAEWPKDESDDKGWKEYLQEWPKVPESIKKVNNISEDYTVIIKEDGEIEVKPGKANDKGEVTAK